MSPIQFVSLGPGEAELITLKGLKALQNADCIFCPETPVRDGHSLSRAADIMLRLDIPANRIRRFSLPMSKQRTDALNAYDQVSSTNSGRRKMPPPFPCITPARKWLSWQREMQASTPLYIIYMRNCKPPASP